MAIFPGWWFGCHFSFSHILGIIIPIDFHIFQKGSNHQPEWQSFYIFSKQQCSPRVRIDHFGYDSRHCRHYRHQTRPDISREDHDSPIFLVPCCIPSGNQTTWQWKVPPVDNMATWIHHLLTKVQQVKPMRSSFRCCAWLEKEWHWESVAPCLVLTCAGWCQRSFHASQAQSSSYIIWMESWRWMKPWETKGLLEKPQCCPALTYRLMCTQHGVVPVSSQIATESLH